MGDLAYGQRTLGAEIAQLGKSLHVRGAGIELSDGILPTLQLQHLHNDLVDLETQARVLAAKAKRLVRLAQLAQTAELSRENRARGGLVAPVAPGTRPPPKGTAERAGTNS